MEKAASIYKKAIILQCIEDGFTPDETAEIINKHAEALNAMCDKLVVWDGTFEKVANPVLNLIRGTGSAINTGVGKTMAGLGFGANMVSKIPWWVPAGMIGAPLGAAAIGSNIIGSQIGNLAAPRNELAVQDYQKIDEILNLKAETAGILERVAARDQEHKERSGARSVRSMF